MGELLAYREDGPRDAPAVVLSPSLGTTWEMWDELTVVLAASYRVIRVDTRGHGRSPAPPGPYSVDGLAADVLAVADAAGVDRFGFVGLSLGGAIGQRLAVAHPSRLLASVLCCTVPVFGEPAGWHERAALVRSSGTAGLAEQTRGRWFTDDFRATRPDQVERFIGMLTGVDREGYAACCEALAGFDATADLGSIRTPTRVVGGAEDPVAPPAAVADLASRIPGADAVVLADASHIASAAQPAAFNAAVEEHLARHLARHL